MSGGTPVSGVAVRGVPAGGAPASRGRRTAQAPRPPLAAERGRVLLVGCGPGAPDLLTVRAVRAIEQADVILHDSLVPPAILALGRPGVRRLRVGRRAGQGGTDVAYLARLAVREARAGNLVVRLQGGDPAVFGRMADELAVLRTAGVPFEVVPGVTAALACAAALEAPLTQRGVAPSLLVTAGSNDAATRAAAALPDVTLTFYMAGRRAPAIAREVIAGGRAPATPAALVLGASLPEQAVWRGTLAQLAVGAPPETDAPVLLVVGEVLAAAAEGRAAESLPAAAAGAVDVTAAASS